MASEYQIISDILGSNYKEDLQTSPWLQASQAMGQAPAIQPGQKWYEALAQGLAFGGVQGGLRGAGLELARQEKQQNAQDTLGFLRALQSGDTAQMAEMEKKSRFMPELSSQLKLAQAVEGMGLGGSSNITPMQARQTALATYPKDPAKAAALEASLVNQPQNIATVILSRLKQEDITQNPDVQKALSGSRATGRLGAGDAFNVGKGIMTPEAAAAIDKAMPEIEKNALYQNYQKLSVYTDQVRSFVEQNHPLADYAAIVSFVKGIDPATAAREGEVEAATNARSIVNNILGKIQKQGNTSTLTTSDKKALITAMETLERTTGRGMYEKVISPQLVNLLGSGGPDAFSAFNFAVPKEYQDYHKSFVDSGWNALDLMQRGDQEGLIRLRSEMLNRARTLPSISGLGDASGSEMVEVIGSSGTPYKVPKEIAAQGSGAIKAWLRTNKR